VAVIQVPLEIPDDIYVRMLAGEYVRVGGVVRDHGGQLVKLLGDASPIDDAQEAAKASIAKVLRNRTVVGIGLGFAVVAATAGGAAYRAKRKTKAAQLELPTSVENYSDSLAAYLEAARHGSLDAEIIERLIADLDAVNAESHSGTITIEFSPEQSETLVGIVAGHTSPNRRRKAPRSSSSARTSKSNGISSAERPDEHSSEIGRICRRARRMRRRRVVQREGRYRERRCCFGRGPAVKTPMCPARSRQGEASSA
jgi:hypothetical protein